MIPALETSDWQEAFGYAGEPETCATSFQGGPDVSAVLGSTVSAALFTRADVAEIGGMCEGENDGPAWIIYGRLTDGRWFFLDSSCDYTGWDCQAGGYAKVAESRLAIISLGMTDEQRARFGLSAAAGDPS